MNCSLNGETIFLPLNDIFSASDHVAELSLRQVTPRPRAEKVVRCAGDKALKDRWNSVGKTGSSAWKSDGWRQHGMNMASMFVF